MGIGINFDSILTYIIMIIAVFIVGLLLLKLLKSPLKFLAVVLFNSLLGGIGLLMFNIIFKGFNLYITPSIFSCIMVGVLGVPGFITLIILSFIL